MRIIDSHIHLDLYEEEERIRIINELKAKGNLAITVSFHLDSCKQNLQLAESGVIYPAFGYHPEQPLPTQTEIDSLLDWMELHQDRMVAVGEVGLPYYRRQEKGMSALEYEQYVQLLERFVAVAKEWDKPIVLHAVYDDAPVVLELLEKHKIQKAQFHWFKGDSITVKQMIKKGYLISVTPDVCYEKEIQQLVQVYPMDLIMVETDGPWPFEGPFEGQQTNPSMIHETIKQISLLKNRPTYQIYEQIRNNMINFFQLNE